MLNVDDYIQTYVRKSKQMEAYKIAIELWDLLLVLDKNGFVREKVSGDVLEKRGLHIAIAKNADKIIASFNKVYSLYFEEKKTEEFQEFMKHFGIYDYDLIHIINSQLIFDYLLDTESFKNILLFMLKGIKPRMPLGRLFTELQKITKDTSEAQKISNHININLRNSLAHFLFREENDTIFYYTHEKNGDWWTLKETPIKASELLDKSGEISLLRAILACMITDWYGLPVVPKTLP